MNPDSRIYVAGHRGLVGSAICRALKNQGYSNVITRERASLDLRDKVAVDRFFWTEQPEYVFVAAAKVGGIFANDILPAEFIYDNLTLQNNLIDAAWRNGTKKLLFMGSSCIYPKAAPQPIKEEYLLTGTLEPTNEWYAIAKIAGIKMCQAYRKQYGFNAISLMPTNLYGPGDNFDLQSSHVVPALMRKLHEAKNAGAAEVTIWGTGTPLREFLYVDDLADASVFLMLHYDGLDIVNVGTGVEVSIVNLAEMIRDVVGFRGKFAFDSSKPDGTPRKLLDVSRLRSLGWVAKTGLRDGLEATYRWYVSQELVRGRDAVTQTGAAKM